MTQVETRTRISTEIELREPSLFRVIYLDDDVTSMEFVVDTLVNHFQYTIETAERIIGDIETTGSAVVAVLPYEIAEQKGIEITMQARSVGFPLQIKLEPDSD
jgi:ATP-dependent Clp protease adaptor protein ClpS